MLPSAVQPERLLPTPVVSDSESAGTPAWQTKRYRGDSLTDVTVRKADEDGRLLPTPMVGSSSPAAHGQVSGQWRDAMDEALARWGDYAPAIARWEAVTGRPAPDPTEPGPKGGRPRLSPLFVEWMMGLEEGHVTAVPGLSRAEQLKLLGNGVVPRQAATALVIMLGWDVSEWAA